jgi:hypothetical protein
MSTKLITSPIGQIQFLALNRKVTKAKTEGSPEGYLARVKFDASTKEGKEWKDAITAINPGIVGKTHTDNKDEFTVRAFSLYLPEVMDGNGNNLEELPNFYQDSKGTASITIQPYEGKNKGEGSINLVGLTIHELDVGEHTGGVEGSREAALAAMRAALGK